MTVEPEMHEADVAAAELALGVLDGEERAAALRRLLAEPDFARDVERWRDQFVTMFAGVAEVTPPAGLFRRIEEKVAPKRTVNPWKPTAIAASLAALAMTAVALRPVEAPIAPSPQVVPAPMIAAMAAADKSDPHPAMYDAASGMVKMPGSMDIPAGKAAQLWAIEGSKAPVPLGVFRQTAPGMYVAEAKMGAVIAPGTILAISIEPPGGSPTGAPTGPVIASGILSKV